MLQAVLLRLEYILGSDRIHQIGSRLVLAKLRGWASISDMSSSLLMGTILIHVVIGFRHSVDCESEVSSSKISAEIMARKEIIARFAFDDSISFIVNT